MATLIPGIGGCTFDTGGERRFAERLEAKLEDDYLCGTTSRWAQRARHPDFIVLHPRRGLLVLEVKDWRPTPSFHRPGQRRDPRPTASQNRDQPAGAGPALRAPGGRARWSATRSWCSRTGAKPASCASPGATAWC